MRFDKIYCSSGSQTSGWNHTKQQDRNQKQCCYHCLCSDWRWTGPLIVPAGADTVWSGGTNKGTCPESRRNRQWITALLVPTVLQGLLSLPAPPCSVPVLTGPSRLGLCPARPDSLRTGSSQVGPWQRQRDPAAFIFAFAFTFAFAFISASAYAFIFLLLFLFSVLPVYFFLFLLFLFFNHFIFYSFSLIFFLLPILCTMTTILSVVNKICKWRCFPLNHQHYRHFYNTDWPPTADRHFVRISVRISQTICRYNSALRHIKKLRYSQGNNGTLK